jgi:hypothetical protein
VPLLRLMRSTLSQTLPQNWRIGVDNHAKLGRNCRRHRCEYFAPVWGSIPYRTATDNSVSGTDGRTQCWWLQQFLIQILKDLWQIINTKQTNQYRMGGKERSRKLYEKVYRADRYSSVNDSRWTTTWQHCSCLKDNKTKATSLASGTACSAGQPFIARGPPSYKSPKSAQI